MKRPEYVPQHFRRAPRPSRFRAEHIGPALVAFTALFVAASVAALVTVLVLGPNADAVTWVTR